MNSDAATPPISYTVDAELRVIFEVWRGDVTANDLKRYWAAYLADPEVMAVRRTLVDLREANIRFNGPEMSNLVMSLVMPALAGRDWHTAIVVGEPVQFGVSRQYQAFAHKYSTDSIFTDYEAALRWLRQQGQVSP